jgi:hypothetical protein
MDGGQPRLPAVLLLLRSGLCAGVPVILGACSTTPERGASLIVPVAGPVATTPDMFQGVKIEPALSELLNRLRVACEIGDEMRCEACIDAARRMDPPGVVESYLNQVEGLVTGRALARGLGREAKIEPVREQVTLGDPVPLRLVLGNVSVGGSSHRLCIPRKVGGGLFSSGPVATTRLHAFVTTTDFDAYGGESIFTNTVQVALRNDIDIPENGNFSMEFQIEGEAPRAAVARVVNVGAELLPAEVRYGDRGVILTRVAFEPGSVVCLPPGYESFALDPVSSLGELLGMDEAAMDRSILPAAMLVTPERKEAALRLLARKLATASALRSRALMAALRYITKDRERGLDRQSWMSWAAAYLASDKK